MVLTREIKENVHNPLTIMAMRSCCYLARSLSTTSTLQCLMRICVKTEILRCASLDLTIALSAERTKSKIMRSPGLVSSRWIGRGERCYKGKLKDIRIEGMEKDKRRDL
jgi:hypothetical protein